MSKYYFILLCLSSCTIKSEGIPCRQQGGDYIFLGQFENCILIITQYQLGNEKVTTEYFSKAVTCLHAITGIKDNDKVGKVVTKPIFDDVLLEMQNILIVKSKGKYGLFYVIDQKQVVDYTYDQIVYTKSNYIGFKGNKVDLLHVKSGQVTVESSGQ